MVKRDVVIAKIANIKKSLDRIKEKENISLEKFLQDRDIQDIVLFNLQTAIQGCIDLAGHIVSDNDLGVAESMGGLFDILSEKKIITLETAKVMRLMVGLRNLIAHEYTGVDMKRIHAAFTQNLGDFQKYIKEVVEFVKL